MKYIAAYALCALTHARPDAAAVAAVLRAVGCEPDPQRLAALMARFADATADPVRLIAQGQATMAELSDPRLAQALRGNSSSVSGRDVFAPAAPSAAAAANDPAAQWLYARHCALTGVTAVQALPSELVALIAAYDPPSLEQRAAWIDQALDPAYFPRDFEDNPVNVADGDGPTRYSLRCDVTTVRLPQGHAVAAPVAPEHAEWTVNAIVETLRDHAIAYDRQYGRARRAAVVARGARKPRGDDELPEAVTTALEAVAGHVRALLRDWNVSVAGRWRVMDPAQARLALAATAGSASESLPVTVVSVVVSVTLPVTDADAGFSLFD